MNLYIPTQKELLNLLEGEDYEILNICINRSDIIDSENTEIERLYAKLIAWCGQIIKEI